MGASLKDAGGKPPADASSENTFEGFVALRLSADLSDRISALLEIGTKRADAGVLNVFAGPSGTGSASLVSSGKVWLRLALKSPK